MTAAPTQDPFARLRRELADLDYTAVDADGSATLTYTGPDARMVAVVDRGTLPPPIVVAEDPHRIVLAGLDLDGTPAWEITCTGTVPEHVQRIALYTVLHAGLGDEASVLRSIADTLGIAPNSGATSAVTGPVG
jgi:hypothetical protein